MTRLATILALAAAFGCGASARQARQVHARLLGTNVHDFKRCLGEPGEFELREGREIWYLARRVSPEEFAGDDLHPMRIKRRSRENARFMVSPRSERPAPGYCRLTAEFGAEGRLVRFEAEGLDHGGGNADTPCMLLARPCVQPLN